MKCPRSFECPTLSKSHSTQHIRNLSHSVDIHSGLASPSLIWASQTSLLHMKFSTNSLLYLVAQQFCFPAAIQSHTINHCASVSKAVIVTATNLKETVKLRFHFGSNACHDVTMGEPVEVHHHIRYCSSQWWCSDTHALWQQCQRC